MKLLHTKTITDSQRHTSVTLVTRRALASTSHSHITSHTATDRQTHAHTHTDTHDAYNTHMQKQPDTCGHAQ